LDRSWVGESNAPKHQQYEQDGEQCCTGVDAWVALQVHEVGSNAVAFDDANTDEDGPNGVKGNGDVRPGDGFKEDSCDFKQREKHQDDEVPKVNVVIARQFVNNRFKDSSSFVFSHVFTSIQIEGREDNHPCQVNKVPVQAEVLNALSISFIVLNVVSSEACFENQVQHDKQASKDVDAVSAG